MPALGLSIRTTELTEGGEKGLTGDGTCPREICRLYTSDAADDTPCVDLGGRRIIKKKYHKLYNHPTCTSPTPFTYT